MSLVNIRRLNLGNPSFVEVEINEIRIMRKIVEKLHKNGRDPAGYISFMYQKEKVVIYTSNLVK